MHHKLLLHAVKSLTIATTLVVLIEPVWTKQQEALESWWRRRRGAKQDRKVSASIMLDRTEE
jgi:hypothetical protein